MLGLVLTLRKITGGLHVVVAPAVRQADGQFVPIPGRRVVAYLIPDSLLLGGANGVSGPIVVRTQDHEVFAVEVMGG